MVLAAGLSLMVGVAGVALSEPGSAGAVWSGVGVGFVIQWALFRGLFIGLLSEKQLLAHGLGMFCRLAVVAMAALLWVPLVGMPAAPFLLSLVTVFFLTTLLEPLFMISFST